MINVKLREGLHLAWREHVRHDTAVDVLRRAPLFASLDDAARRRLIACGDLADLRPRQRLWSHGERADAIGVILSGRLLVGLEHGRRQVVMDVLGAAETVGEVGLSLSDSHHFDVTCLRRARVLLLPNRIIRGWLTSDPRASAALAHNLANSVVRLTYRLSALCGGTVEQRLARVLSNLADRFGEPFPGGVLIALKLRREDLASLTATTMESVSRQVSRWRAQGLLLPQPAGYLIRDTAALAALGTPVRRLGDFPK